VTVLYLFDIDGTLLEARGSGRDAFDAVFAEHHGIADASSGIRYGGKTDPAIIDEIFLARLGRPATEPERAAFLAAYLPRLHALLDEHGVVVYDGVVDALQWLAARSDVALGIATGNIRAGADAKLAAGKLGGWFRFGGYGCDSRVRAELVAKAVARGRADRDVREVVVVGDTIHDIAAARACGATICAVATGSDSAEDLAHADVVWSSMSELISWHAQRFDEAP
jgi:phosphoglycolate phosphatase-like HAD superfamily hydrolase